QASNIFVSKFCDLLVIKTMKGFAEILSLRKYGSPTQSGLEPFQAQLFKQTKIIIDRKAPFFIVVVEKLRCCSTPAAARLTVWCNSCGAHGVSSTHCCSRNSN